MDYAVDVSGVTVRAGNSSILDKVSFRAARGDFTAILGASGAGKTTLIKTILGFNKISSGSVKILGKKLSRNSADGIRAKCGYVPQSVSVDRFFPVLAGDVLKMGGGDAGGIVSELRIKNLLESPFGLLSGGEKQKILLAMALSREPELLLLDEPNLNLDMFAYRDFLSLVDRIHVKHGLTVIFITHLINQLPESCRRVIVMKKGGIAFESNAKRLLKCKKAPELIYG